MKKFKLTVSSTLGFLSINKSDVNLTDLGTEFVVDDAEELSSGIKSFLNEVDVGYMKNMDIKHESSASYQNNFRELIRSFHLIPDLWNQKKSWAGTNQWNITLENVPVADS